MLGDLGLAEAVSNTQETNLAERILNAFSQRGAATDDERAADLAHIVYMANCFDEQLEFAPFEQDGIEKVLAPALGDHGRAEEAVSFVLRTLRKASLQDLTAVIPKLPVYPAIAMRLYRLLSNEEINLVSLESIARTDQVVAGKLVKAANSIRYSPWQPIRSVTQAISYVGTDDARRILLASSLQPLFAAPRVRQLWKHALEAAQVAEKIADLSGNVDPAEAFLLGLLHDVGKLAIALMSAEINAAVDRLIARECQPATAELVLCGFDHAEAGAEVLKHWRFAQECITAIQCHHQPERTDSRMASILYLTEFWTDSEEDLPSNARLTTALRIAGLTPEALESARMDLNEAISSL